MVEARLVAKKIKAYLVLMYKSYFGKQFNLFQEKMISLLLPVTSIPHAFTKDRCGSLEDSIVE
jgi:hypothetical protein